jgi:hypothetical protein
VKFDWEMDTEVDAHSVLNTAYVFGHKVFVACYNL